MRRVRLAVRRVAGRCAVLLITVPTGGLSPAPGSSGGGIMTDHTGLPTAGTTLPRGMP
jgi:hypothetical protein